MHIFLTTPLGGGAVGSGGNAWTIQYHCMGGGWPLATGGKSDHTIVGGGRWRLAATHIYISFSLSFSLSLSLYIYIYMAAAVYVRPWLYIYILQVGAEKLKVPQPGIKA